MILRLAVLLLACILTNCTSTPLEWTWSYSAPGIIASGSFTTERHPNAQGFYRILNITGTRNGDPIANLHPALTPIPGNEPYKVDNLISANPQSHLTNDGFGYATKSGQYGSSFLTSSGYMEVFSARPFIAGAKNLGSEDSERAINFSAAPLRLSKVQY